jgi:hypothetical protein
MPKLVLLDDARRKSGLDVGFRSRWNYLDTIVIAAEAGADTLLLDQA